MTIIWASHKLFEHLQVRKADSTRCEGNWVSSRFLDHSWSCSRSNDDGPRRLYGANLRMEA